MICLKSDHLKFVVRGARSYIKLRRVVRYTHSLVRSPHQECNCVEQEALVLVTFAAASIKLDILDTYLARGSSMAEVYAVKRESAYALQCQTRGSSLKATDWWTLTLCILTFDSGMAEKLPERTAMSVNLAVNTATARLCFRCGYLALRG